MTENRKLDISKHLYKCSQGEFKIMPIYQTNEYRFIDKFQQKLNKT